jgi:ABC-2 type transport system ATP-binding protein
MDPISLARVTKRYGPLEALKDVSFGVAAGEMFGLIGPDGAGKTTTIRLICGLLAREAGEIRVFGRDPVAEHRAVTAEVGYLSQRFSLYGDLSVDENIAFFAEIHGVRRFAARRTRLLEMMQLTPFRSRLAGQLSGGMKQKLALACTLVHEPRLILLDEPTTGVDPVSRREFWRIIADLHRRGVTVFVATPYMDEAERCSRVAFMRDGVLEVVDTPAAVKGRLPGTLYEVVAPAQREAMAALRGLAGVRSVSVQGEALRVLSAPGGPDERALAEALAREGLAVTRVAPARVDMEAAFAFLAEEPGGEAS